MAISLEEWNEVTKKIVASGEDQAVLTTMVTQASDAFNELFAENTRTKQENESLKQENETLKKYNLDLFMRIEDQRPGANDRKKDEDKAKVEAETITFDDLFKEE